MVVLLEIEETHLQNIPSMLHKHEWFVTQLKIREFGSYTIQNLIMPVSKTNLQ